MREGTLDPDECGSRYPVRRFCYISHPYGRDPDLLVQAGWMELKLIVATELAGQASSFVPAEPQALSTTRADNGGGQTHSIMTRIREGDNQFR